MDRMSGKCPQYPNAIITFDNLKLIRKGRIYILSTKITVKETVQNDMRLEMKGLRCRYKDAPDTCEDYQTIHINKMCELINANNYPWSPFVNQMKPKLRCPIQKGVYHVMNGTFDGNSFPFASLPVEDWYWKMNTKTREIGTNRLILCTYLEGQIVPV